MKKSCVGKFCIMTMLAMEAGMIQAYANSPGGCRLIPIFNL